MMTKFVPDDGIQHSPSLPTPVARVRWFHGDPKMFPIKDKDPIAYYGGFTAFVKAKDGQMNPPLPWKVYTRSLPYGVVDMYCSRVAAIVPIAGRARFETIGADGNVSGFMPYYDKRQPGKPHLQLYALVVDMKSGQPDWSTEYYALVEIVGWSAFISYGNAVKIWHKLEKENGSLLVRFYGTSGEKPNFKDTDKGRVVTEIAAITDKIIPIPEEIRKRMSDLQVESVLWKSDRMWRGEKTAPTPFDQTEFDVSMEDVDEIPY